MTKLVVKFGRFLLIFEKILKIFLKSNQKVPSSNSPEQSCIRLRFVVRVYHMIERYLKKVWWDGFYEEVEKYFWDPEILHSRAIPSIISSNPIFSMHSWLGFKWSYLCFRAVQAYCCTMMVFGFNLRNFDFSATCLVVAKNAKLFCHCRFWG